MGRYAATARLTNDGADVHLGRTRIAIAHDDGTGGGHGCPMSHLAGALGG